MSRHIRTPRQMLAEALLEHRAELMHDLAGSERYPDGIVTDWMDMLPAADMILEVLGLEQTGWQWQYRDTTEKAAWWFSSQMPESTQGLDIVVRPIFAANGET